MLAACGQPHVFPCTDDTQCLLGTAPGRCERDGFCSFPDVTCESGARYGEHSPGELRGTCVTAPSNDACEVATELVLGAPIAGELRGAASSGILACSPQAAGEVF